MPLWLKDYAPVCFGLLQQGWNIFRLSHTGRAPSPQTLDCKLIQPSQHGALRKLQLFYDTWQKRHGDSLQYVAPSPQLGNWAPKIHAVKSIYRVKNSSLVCQKKCTADHQPRTTRGCFRISPWILAMMGIIFQWWQWRVSFFNDDSDKSYRSKWLGNLLLNVFV